ncbi:HEAT repeat domain-containing protein [Nannocystis radixulma]|uniref:HEAT repeat domain-containing protein n=1 Tax=Nannocystis radixulma TaxID=2995305 RepID=A0ABT5B301_9BACT|nr:HEAT repeat domain-containing protein [Nannocystis radixulma]MDC0668492.1 HEAT repeat domain-containing protein [Nannocystis radixulma]
MTPERLQERLAVSPELAALVATLDGSGRAEDAETFFARADAFAAVLASTTIAALVRHELAALVGDPARTIQDSFEGTWIVAADPRFELALVAAPAADEAPSSILHGSPRHRLLGVFGCEAVEVEWFEHSRAHPIDVFDRSLVLAPLGVRTLRRGEVLRQRAWFDVVAPRPVREPGYLLVFASAPVDRLRWTYERATLRPHRPTPTSLTINHIEYAIGTLLHLGHPESAAAIEGLVEHPAHHIRWTAIRAIVELDQARGVELLAAALNDPHPHVRSAARRGLDGLGEAEG